LWNSEVRKKSSLAVHRVERDDSNLEISKTFQMKTHVKPFDFVKDFFARFSH
jgi:hypothetical protein